MSRRPALTEKVKDKVVRDYLRGDKAIIIQMEHEVSPGEMYRILHARQVSLRTSGTAKPGRKTRQVPSRAAMSAQLQFGLELLKGDVIKAFKQDMSQGRNRQVELKYGISEWDVYMEALIERNDLESIIKMLKHWIKYLGALADCQHTRGAILALQSLVELCSTIDKMAPPED